METKRTVPYHMLTDEKRRADYRQGAVLAIRGGQSKTAVAARLHVSRETIYTWLDRADPQTGEVDLHDPGPESRMDAAMRGRLATLIDQGPRACGFDFDAWTLPRLALLVERKFEVRFSEQRVSTLMREMGYSPQKPERSAKERKHDKVMEWKRTVLPAVGEKSG